MPYLNLADLPDQARYENSCRSRTSWYSRPSTIPFASEEVTIYLTSSGEVCLFDKNASGLPVSSIFSLTDVKDVSYHGKKVNNKLFFHAGTLLIATFGLIWLLITGISVLDYILNYESYYSYVPDIEPSETVSAGVDGGIRVGLFILFYHLVMEYIRKKLADWSDAERIDFILESDEKISLYGKFPFERRFDLHVFGFASVLVVLIPIVLCEPQMLLFFFVIETLAISIALLLQRLARMVVLDPDENEGSVEIGGLKDFYDGVRSLSPPTASNNVKSDKEIGEAVYQFDLLVDRLSNDVSALDERLRVYEKALDEITKTKWRYTLRVPEVDQGLNQIRKCAERVLFQRVTNLGITTLGPRAGLEEMIGVLLKNKAIPSKPLSDLEVIQAKTSPGSHATTGYAENDDDYITGLRALVNLVEWHFENIDNFALDS